MPSVNAIVPVVVVVRGELAGGDGLHEPVHGDRPGPGVGEQTVGDQFGEGVLPVIRQPEACLDRKDFERL